MHAQRPEQLLFLPGASGNDQLWRGVADELNHPAERRFIRWPGFGGAPIDPHVCGMSDLVTYVTRELHQPVALLAQSMGGVVAIRAALEKPQRVTHLVLSVTSGGLDVRALGGADWRPLFRAANPTLPNWFEIDRSDLSDQLRELRQPVLLLWGDSDPISPVEVGQRLAALLPNSELYVVRGGTHDLVAERASEITPLIARHLQKPASGSL